MSDRICQGCGTELPPKTWKGRDRKWCSDRCRKQTLYARACVDCGALTNGSNGHGPHAARWCGKCNAARGNAVRIARAHARRAAIQALWVKGQTLLQIADALGSTRNSIGAELTHMRHNGWDVPHRYEYKDGALERIAAAARETRRKAAA